MSRYVEGDGDDEFWVLDQGRWQNNARRALKSKRGRKALAEIREALLALPEKRLIGGAMCTVGSVDARYPAMTGGDVDAAAAEIAGRPGGMPAPYARRRAELRREAREEERGRYAELAAAQGEGVCLIGAYLWHRKVREGTAPAEAFGALPALFDGEADTGDPLWSTALLAEEDAGMARTLAWELAYRNDETYGQMTPEERYTAFLAWIDAELGDSDPGAGAVPVPGTTETRK